MIQKFRPSWPFIYVSLGPYKRKLRKEIKKNSLGINFVPEKLRSNKVFALLMAFSKCVDTPVGLGE